MFSRPAPRERHNLPHSIQVQVIRDARRGGGGGGGAGGGKGEGREKGQEEKKK